MWAILIGAIIVGILCASSESGSYSSSNYGNDCTPSYNTEEQENNGIRRFKDGTWDVEGVFGERQRSDGTYSYKDFWDREITSDGKMIDQLGRIYDQSTGERIGTRWTDCFGAIHDDID